VARLSALVSVHNQEAQLSACLRRLSFCDEIVVVADRCTDGSQEIARRHGAILVDGIFPLENQRKAAALEACTGQWILELDADELVDDALAWEIRAVLQMRPAADGYDIPIDNYVGGSLVRDGWTGAISAGRALRLFKPGVKTWRPRRLDDGGALDGFEIGALKGAIRRDLGHDIGSLFERVNRLSALRAEDLADSARPGGVGGGLLAGLSQFLASFVGRRGWREGRLGFLVAMLSALYPVVSRIRASEVLEARQIALAETQRPTRFGEVVGLAR
jgi:glycosyltransferase involved in cell wall biosynthesis